MTVRSGESERSWMRASRFFTIQGNWYCITREGTSLGPCDSRADAEVELMMFLRHVQEGRPPETYSPL